MGDVREWIRRKGRRGTLPPITAAVSQNEAEEVPMDPEETEYEAGRGDDEVERTMKKRS